MFQLPFPVRDANAGRWLRIPLAICQNGISAIYIRMKMPPNLKRDLDWLEEACASFARDFEASCKPRRG